MSLQVGAVAAPLLELDVPPLLEPDEPDELLLDPLPEVDPELDPDPDPELDPDPDPELVLDPELLPPEPELGAPELDPAAAPLLDPVAICAVVEAGGGLDVPPYGPPRGASEPPHATTASKAAPITPCFPRDPSKRIAELPTSVPQFVDNTGHTAAVVEGGPRTRLVRHAWKFSGASSLGRRRGCAPRVAVQLPEVHLVEGPLETTDGGCAAARLADAEHAIAQNALEGIWKTGDSRRSGRGGGRSGEGARPPSPAERRLLQAMQAGFRA
jgi:hypothetical protein